MSAHTLLTVPAAAVLALGVTLGVSACNPLAAVTEQVAEQAIEDATGGSIDIDAGGGVSLPADFPADVPVIDAKLTASSGLGAEGSKVWTVVYSVNDPVASYDAAAKLLTDAGYTVVFEQDTGDGKVGSFDNGTWNVSLGTTPAVGSEESVLTYIVGASSGS